MALPDNLRDGLLPSEAEFLATSSTEINIVPLMRIDRVRVLGGVYGPLRPPQQARVPLWMALSLKKRKRCSIVCPDWMQVDALRELHRAEVTSEAFAPVPLHYMAISKVLLQEAVDDVPRSDEVRAVLKSIREARQSKIMEGIKNVNTEHLAIDDISAGEITELRPFLGTAFKHLVAMQRAAEPVGDPDDPSQPQSSYNNGDCSFSWTYSSPEKRRQQARQPFEAEDSRQPFTSSRSRMESDDTMRDFTDRRRVDDGQGRRQSSVQDESQNNMDLF